MGGEDAKFFFLDIGESAAEATAKLVAYVDASFAAGHTLQDIAEATGRSRAELLGVAEVYDRYIAVQERAVDVGTNLTEREREWSAHVQAQSIPAAAAIAEAVEARPRTGTTTRRRRRSPVAGAKTSSRP